MTDAAYTTRTPELVRRHPGGGMNLADAFRRLHDLRGEIENTLEAMLEVLDTIDAPGHDLEDDGEAGATRKLGDHTPDFDRSEDAEPSLAAPERHPTAGWTNFPAGFVDTRNSQDHWADGDKEECEEDIGDEAELENEHGTDIDAGELDEAEMAQ